MAAMTAHPDEYPEILVKHQCGNLDLFLVTRAFTHLLFRFPDCPSSEAFIATNVLPFLASLEIKEVHE